MKKLLFTLFTLCMIHLNAYSQNPCSINAGTPIDICATDVEFNMNGSVGTNVNLQSLSWDSEAPDIFQIVDPNSLNTAIIVDHVPPADCYTFTLTGTCNDGTGTVLSTSVEVCVADNVTQARITVNGDDVDEITICHEVLLSGNTNLQAGETGCWYYTFQDDEITVDGENCTSNDLTVSIGNKYFATCKEYDFFYQVTRGGCISTDKIRVRFVGQNENVRVYRPSNNSAICDETVQFWGSNVGCLSDLTNWDFTLLNPGNYTNPPMGGNKIMKEDYTFQTFEFYESGQYTFVYNVDPDIVCHGGTDTVTFDICVVDLPIIFDFKEEFCGPIPNPFNVVNELHPEYEYGDWIVTSNNATIEQIGDQVIITPDDNVMEITATQTYQPFDCHGFSCGGTREITLISNDAPTIETNDLVHLCGSLYNFNPWDRVDVTGGDYFSGKVISVPVNSTTVVEGQTFDGNYVSLNLVENGEYEFILTYEILLSDDPNCVVFDTLTVLICDAGQPAAPVVSSFCPGEIVQLAGTTPGDDCAKPLWTHISGPQIQFVNGSSATDIFPFITVHEPGEVCIEYSYSREADCYLAETTCFIVDSCTNDCITTSLIEVYCDDQGTEDTADDYWYFDILVVNNSGNQSYWSTSGDINENGSYGEIKTIYPGGTIANNPSSTFTIYDANNPECSTLITVDAPEPCSISCDLEVEYTIGDCNDNDTPNYVSDDYFTVTLSVTGTNDQPYMIKQKYGNGTEVLIYQGTHDDTNIQFTFLAQDGDFTLWIFLSDYFDCLIDIYINAPESCSGCLAVTVNDILCYDNGSSDPNDDYWTFDILVDGGNGYWTATDPVNESGGYGSTKTIWMGAIDGGGSPVNFQIFDNEDRNCVVDVSVTPPAPCSIECKLDVQLETECRNKNVYYINAKVEVHNDECFMVKRKNADGTEEVLGTYSGPQMLEFGPFNANEEFTLWIMLCESFECVRDFYIQAPEDCGDCIDYEIVDITCYDNGTSDPSDDYWSFDILVSGPNDYWTASPPINESGPYGSVKTIWVGSIESHPDIQFNIFDNADENCNTTVKLEAPKPCSVECKLEVNSSISDCIRRKDNVFFSVTLDVQIQDNACFMVKKKNADGSEELLGTYTGPGIIVLGLFVAGEDFTLWIMGCDSFDCVRDIYIKAPDCKKIKEGKNDSIKRSGLAETNKFTINPNPSSTEITINLLSDVNHTFYIRDYSGKTMNYGDITDAKQTIDISNLPDGLYFIQIVNSFNEVQVRKFSIIH